MPSENTSELRRPCRSHNSGAPPQEQEHLPCPRCDSTNTKFCYYNNYNFSQPRHFCKSCRRYWTHGGTLRDIPIGGGTRKIAKRSRTVAPSSSTQDQALPATVTPFYVSLSGSPPATMQIGAAVASSGDVIAKQNLNVYESFTSMLNNASQGPGFLALPGFGLDIGPTLEDVNLGMTSGVWPLQAVVDGNTWQFENRGGRFISGDCLT